MRDLELDSLMAEKIMGWHALYADVVTVTDNTWEKTPGGIWGWERPSGSIVFLSEWSPSTNIVDAMVIIEYYRKQKGPWYTWNIKSMRYLHYNTVLMWKVILFTWISPAIIDEFLERVMIDNQDCRIAIEESLPMAICKAARMELENSSQNA